MNSYINIGERMYDLKSKKNVFGELIFLLNKNHNEYLNECFKEYELNTVQGLFLLKLNEFPETTQRDLGRHFSLSKGSVAKYFIDLENKGYIKREKIGDDKRRYKITLTSKSKELIPVFRQINYNWDEKVGLNDLGDDFIVNLSKLLENASSEAVE